MRFYSKNIAMLTLWSLLFGLFSPFVDAAPIDSVDKYAWSDQIGWINFNPTNGGVDVSDTTLTGAIWSDNYGWINLQPSTSGVDNVVVDDPTLGCIGNLSGQAWNTNLGWLDFANVYINGSGSFMGTASGTLFGNVSFQGTNYGVKTSWLPDCIAPVVSGAPDMTAATDTGSGNTDNITSTTLPSFILQCSETPSTLTLYSGTGVIATHSCTSVGSVTVPSTVVLSEGLHSITYTETDATHHVSPASPNLDIVIDTTSPSVNITAPTKLDNAAITDTTFSITDAQGFDVASIVLGTGSLTTSVLVCIPSSGVVTSVSCTVSIDSSGDFSVSVPDLAGNTGTDTETNYVVDLIAPTLPSVSIDISGGINAPVLTFSSTDNIAIDHYEIIYAADDGGVGTGTLTTLNPATSPASLTLDPHELVHTVIVRVYDTAGNMTEKTVKFPPLVNFTTPTLISNTPITDSTVTITSPDGNPLTNIVFDAGDTGASLGTCTGAGGDTTDPYDNPVTCTIQNITAQGIVSVTAQDSITGAQGENSQFYIVETSAPTITITAPTKIENTVILDTTLTIVDNIGILASSVDLSTSTASYSNLACTQTSATRVDCTLQIDGSGDISVSVSDQAGNTNTVTETQYIIDTTAPTLSINSLILASSLNSSTYPVSGTCSVGDGNISVTIPGANPSPQSVTCTPSGTWSTLFDVSGISEGTGVIAVSASQTDSAGNTGTSGPSLADKDAIAPLSPTVVSLSPNPAATGGVVTLSLSGVETGASVSVPNMTCSPIPTGANGLVSCTGTASTTLLNGTNNTVTVTDAAGNTNTSLTAPILVLDSTAPGLPVCTANPNPTTGATTITCTGVEEGSTMNIPGMTCTPSPATVTGQVVCTGTIPSTNPPYSLTDALSNTATGTVLVTLDTTAPSNPTVVSLSPNPATTGTTVTLTLSGVEAGASVSFPNMTCSPTPTGVNGLVSCTGIASTTLLNGTNNTVTVTDAAGNQNTNVTAPTLSISSGGSGGGSSGPKSDKCNGNDTSGSIYDGKCSKTVSNTGSESTSSSITPVPVTPPSTPTPVTPVIPPVTPTLPLIPQKLATEDGKMIKEINGKKIGYTIQNTFENCPIIDALNDTTYPYISNAFPDSKLSKYKETVDKFASLKITQGNTNGLFEPQREISRAEFTKMVLISHCYTYNEEDPTWLPYTDIDTKTWQSRVISKAQKLGIISGDTLEIATPYLTDKLSPESIRSLKQRFKNLGLYSGEVNTSYTDDFFEAVYQFQKAQELVSTRDDIGAGYWRIKTREKFQEIYGGTTSIDVFRPDDIITKAEATKILMRMAMVQANTLENMNYTDVSVDWHKKYVQTGETLGIFDSIEDKKIFNPDAGVTRENMVHMIQKVVDLYR